VRFMKIRVETSGGLAGIPTTSEIDTNKLPNSLEVKVTELMNKKYLPRSKALRAGHTRSADCLSYKITIRNGKTEYVIDCNELDMDKGMKSLLSYVRKNSKSTVAKRP
jgi:emfourin